MATVYQARVERHSVGPAGQELVSFVIEFPRVVLAETVTHRRNSDSWGGEGFSVCERTTTPDVSKNSASSRAIPHERFLSKIAADPYMPAFTGKAKGMQGAHLAPNVAALAADVWLAARHEMVTRAGQLNQLGVHKQDSNRLLEPWAWVTQIVTSTGDGWANFFALRCHNDAHPAFRKVARMMFLALRESTPDRLNPGQWHLPFVPKAEALAVDWWRVTLLPDWREMPAPLLASIARCAWLSYENHEKDASPEAIDRTVERLIGSRPVHASPCEHQGTPVPGSPGLGFGHGILNGNLPGWIQLRKLLPAERAATYDPPQSEVESWPEFAEWQASK